MSYLSRTIQKKIDDVISRGKSILLLGPRQTGKTTLIEKIPASLNISFISPRVRLRYEIDPTQLADEIEAIAENSKKKPLLLLMKSRKSR